MKIAEGIYLHFIKNTKFKTNHIKVRFTGRRDEKTIAKRALVAQMMESVNAIYTTQQAFQKELSRLYGASLSTQVTTRGLVHMVDVDMVFVRENFLLRDDSIVRDCLAFLEAALFHPLVSVAQYRPKNFEVEKKNLLNQLGADLEDPFYAADRKLREIYFENPVLTYSKYGTKELVEKENSYTVYQEFQKMMQEDRVDIFVLGEIEEYLMVQLAHQFPQTPRRQALEFSVARNYSKITREKVESKEYHQTLVNLAYQLPVSYGTDDYFTLLVFNGLLGGFSHSKLFSTVREKEGLAYTIETSFDVSTQLYKVYAGIDRNNRQRVLQLINQQLSHLRLGRFSKTEIDQTKKMLEHQAMLAEDFPESVLELAYNHATMGDLALDLDVWLARVHQISKEDIMRLARKIKLQAVYVMEGHAQ